MMKLEFSVPIYKYKINDWEEKKKTITNILNKSDSRLVGNVITTSMDQNLFLFQNEIRMFEKEVGLDLVCTELWFQKYENNMDHSVHTHGPIGFSSVCFVEYDKKCHKPTIFVSPFYDNITGDLLKYEPDVEEGDLLFFPANLMHYAPVNCSNKIRITAAFNLFFREKMFKQKPSERVVYQ